jgi:hypothetical protein
MAKKEPPPGVREVRELFSTPEAQEFFRKQGAKGGKLSAAARMEKLTPEQRSAIAKNAVAAREAKRKKGGQEVRRRPREGEGVVMAPNGKKPLSINIGAELLARVDVYRFDQRLLSRSKAIEDLLRTALDLHEAQARWAGHEAKRPGAKRKAAPKKS